MREFIDIALKEYGTKEIGGDSHNPAVLKYFDATDYIKDGLTDEVPWCAAFINWVIENAGYKGTRKVNARSLLDWGEPIDHPEFGCVVVLWRNSVESWEGHAGFYVSDGGDNIYLLSGNQGDEVNISPFSKKKILGYRRPQKTITEKISELNITDMKELKGFKTIMVAILMFGLAGLDAWQTQYMIPDWVYQFIYPGIMFLMRFLTDSPIGGKPK